MNDIESGQRGDDPFQRENEDELIQNPRFVCDLCGFANVRLVENEHLPAAVCTNCGACYLETGDDR